MIVTRAGRVVATTAWRACLSAGSYPFSKWRVDHPLPKDTSKVDLMNLLMLGLRSDSLEVIGILGGSALVLS